MLKFIDWVGRLQTAQGIVQWAWVAWPTGMASMTAILGYLTNQPLMYIFESASIVLAAVSVSVYYITVFKEKKDPINKIKFGDIILFHELAPQIEHNRPIRRAAQKEKVLVALPPRRLVKAQLGVQLINTSTFPISLFVTAIETELDSKTPPRVKRQKEVISIQAGAMIWVHDAPIEMQNAQCGIFTGSVDFKIKYGYSGQENLELSHTGNIEVLFEPFGFLKTIYFHPDPNKLNL